MDSDFSDVICVLGNLINPSFVTNEEIVPKEMEMAFVKNKLAKKRVNFVLFVAQ